MSDDALRLADELREALDDPKRGEWGGYPWEHLGDAERDVRVLLALAAEVEQLRERNGGLTRDFNAMLVACSKAEAEVEQLREALRPFAENWDFHAADYLTDLIDGKEVRVIEASVVDEIIAAVNGARRVLAAPGAAE